jgi:hypothetical protein
MRHSTTFGDALAPQVIGDDGMIRESYGYPLDKNQALK